nr:hypothetical protein [Clostridioides mangenotii]
MVKKVLIMSASTGGGHNRAAKAIKEELTIKEIDGIKIECEIIDSLKLVNNTMDKIISQGYEKSAFIRQKPMEVFIAFLKAVLFPKMNLKTTQLLHLWLKSL